MSMTGKEARKLARNKIAELKRLSDELSEIMKELPIPTPEEFEAMRQGKKPWTEEAHVAAVIRNADFYIEEAATTITDYVGRNAQWLNLIWKKAERPAPPFERSLRYLVAARSGQTIPPSEAEVYFYDPSARGRAVLRMFLDLLMETCGQFIRRLATVDGVETTGDSKASR
jgi:SpoVK/Ycf46/Vps4 family AAA+-type ATPase